MKTTTGLYNIKDEYRLANTSDDFNILRAIITNNYEDGDPQLLVDIARNEAAPADILSGLAYCYLSEVRACVARNVSTPYSTIFKLSRDDDSSVRYAALSRL